MEYAHLGRIGLKVSRLALGTMNFGELTDEATSFAILDDADAAAFVVGHAMVIDGGQTV